MNNNFLETNTDFNLDFFHRITDETDRVYIGRNLKIVEGGKNIKPINTDLPGFSPLVLKNKLGGKIDSYSFASYEVPMKNYGFKLNFPDEVEEESALFISNKIKKLEVGDYYFMMCCFLPYSMRRSSQKVIYESSDTSKAEFISHNIFLCKDIGEVTISVKSISNPEITDSFTLNIEKSNSIKYDKKEQFIPTDIGISIGDVDDEIAKNNFKLLKNFLESKIDIEPTELIFPEGITIQILQPSDEDKIFLPSNLDVNMNGSTIKEKVNEYLKYDTFVFGDYSDKLKPECIRCCTNTRFRNGFIIGEYGEKKSNAEIGYHEGCKAFHFDYAIRCGLDNMTIRNYPGFTITSTKGLHSNPISLKPDLFVSGKLNMKTGKVEYSTESIITNDYVDITQFKRNQFDISSPYGYGGYITGTRHFNICFYNENKEFISGLECARMCLNQFIPENSKYVKIEFFTKAMPVIEGNSMYMKDREEPYRCFIKNCIIKDNKSCGFAPAGGSFFRIEGNIWSGNDKQGPACDCDYEDGWQLQGYCDVWKNNTFNSKTTLIICSGKGFIILDNDFNNSYCFYNGLESMAFLNNRINNTKEDNRHDSSFYNSIENNTYTNSQVTCNSRYRSDIFILKNNKLIGRSKLNIAKAISEDTIIGDGIRITHNMYENCTITFNGASYMIDDTFKNVTFKIESEKVIQLDGQSYGSENSLLFYKCNFNPGDNGNTKSELSTTYGTNIYFKDCIFNIHPKFTDHHGNFLPKLTFENCTFNFYIENRETIYVAGGGHYIFKDCKFNNFRLYTDTFKGALCEFIGCSYTNDDGDLPFFTGRAWRDDLPWTFIKLVDSESLTGYEMFFDNVKIIDRNDNIMR